MAQWITPAKRFAYEDGSSTPPCKMCGRPRMRKNIGQLGEGLHLYCGPRGCESPERICQRFGCGRTFSVAPGMSKYCKEHAERAH